ncbi:DUF6950 family protein [Zavarzinia aquatilis]|nr:hypothetical protein [Zavarzinia aquatilis]
MLRDYLESCCRRRWEWGSHDCTLFAADWVLAVTGTDPAAGWRGRYGSADECRARLLNAGGLEAVVARAMTAARFSETDAPVTGDVGLVRAPTALDGMGVVSAIRQGDLWVVRGIRRLLAAPFPTARAWRVAA